MNRKYTLLTFLLLYAIIGILGLVCLFSMKNVPGTQRRMEAISTENTESSAGNDFSVNTESIAAADSSDDSEKTADSDPSDGSEKPADDSEIIADSSSSDRTENTESVEPDITAKDFPDTPIGTFTVNENALSLRTKPSFNCRIQIYLKKGSTGDVFWEDENWVGISYKNFKGFVAADYVTVEKKNGD